MREKEEREKTIRRIDENLQFSQVRVQVRLRSSQPLDLLLYSVRIAPHTYLGLHHPTLVICCYRSHYSTQFVENKTIIMYSSMRTQH